MAFKIRVTPWRVSPTLSAIAPVLIPMAANFKIVAFRASSAARRSIRLMGALQGWTRKRGPGGYFRRPARSPMPWREERIKNPRRLGIGRVEEKAARPARQPGAVKQEKPRGWALGALRTRPRLI